MKITARACARSERDDLHRRAQMAGAHLHASIVWRDRDRVQDFVNAARLWARKHHVQAPIDALREMAS